MHRKTNFLIFYLLPIPISHLPRSVPRSYSKVQTDKHTSELKKDNFCEQQTMASHDDHDHDHQHPHHDQDHDHTHGDSTTKSCVGPDGKVYHEPIYSPGYFSRRAPPLLTRDFNERAFTVGIGGPVGTVYLLFPILTILFCCLLHITMKIYTNLLYHFFITSLFFISP